MTHSAPRLPVLLLAVAAACGGDRGAPENGPPSDTSTTQAPAPVRPGDPGSDAASASADSTFAALRAAVCDTIDNSLDCARAVEARRLPATDRALRRGGALVLRLEAGDSLRLADRADGDPSAREYHSFQGHWEDRSYFLVQKQYYEGAEYLLVQDSTGAVTRLPSWPLLAPDGARFAVLSLDLVAGYGPNTLQIWSFDGGSPAREWETEPSQWGPREGRWTSPDTLRFTQYGYCDQLGGEGRGMCGRPAALHREGGSWHLRVGDELR